MKFGILFTSHPDIEKEPYPHRDVHERVTRQIVEADRLGYDIAWIAEHHFSNTYGIMPDPFVYAGYLADKTERIKIGTGVITLPLYDPMRVVENTAFVDLLTKGRFMLGLGSGYRPYEFEGFGVPFEERRDIQEEAIDMILECFHTGRVSHAGKYFSNKVEGDYEIFPRSIQQPHPPLYMAGGSERSIGYGAEKGLGLMLSTLTRTDDLATQIGHYRTCMNDAPAELTSNPAFGHVDVARWVYVAETDAKAKEESEAGIVKHISAFMGKNTAGYLGTVQKGDVDDVSYDELAETTLLHGSPDTVIEKLKKLQRDTGMTSVVIHYPPYYGHEKSVKMLKLFAETVLPELQKEEQPLTALAAE